MEEPQLDFLLFAEVDSLTSSLAWSVEIVPYGNSEPYLDPEPDTVKIVEGKGSKFEFTISDDQKENILVSCISQLPCSYDEISLVVTVGASVARGDYAVEVSLTDDGAPPMSREYAFVVSVISESVSNVPFADTEWWQEAGE